MSTHQDAPASRLICFGGATALTNAVSEPGNPEIDPELSFVA
jgi:hypothetical protein